MFVPDSGPHSRPFGFSLASMFFLSTCGGFLLGRALAFSYRWPMVVWTSSH